MASWTLDMIFLSPNRHECGSKINYLDPTGAYRKNAEIFENKLRCIGFDTALFDKRKFGFHIMSLRYSTLIAKLRFYGCRTDCPSLSSSPPSHSICGFCLRVHPGLFFIPADSCFKFLQEKFGTRIRDQRFACQKAIGAKQ